MIEGGYICVARKIQESDIWKKPAEWLKIWIYLLQEVNHVDNRMFQRGTNFFNYNDISRFCLVRYPTVDNCLRWLKFTGQITTEKTTRGVIIKVLNYAKYQTSKNYEYDTDNDTSQEMKTEWLRNGTDTINKNEKNSENEKNEKELTLRREETPATISNLFFQNKEEQEKVEQFLVSQGVPIQTAVSEVAKFVSYWTEPNPSGTKQRWQMEKTFELKRRLGTWFRNIKSFSSKETKGITL